MASSLAACNLPSLAPSLYQKPGPSSRVQPGVSLIVSSPRVRDVGRAALLKGCGVTRAVKNGIASRREIQGNSQLFKSGQSLRFNEQFLTECRRLMRMRERVSAEPEGKQLEGTTAMPSAMVDSIKQEWDENVSTRPPTPSTRSKLNAIFTVAAAAAFGLGIGVAEGSGKASQFLAGYLLELSLSVDNLFVFVLVFDYFQVPTASQSKVLGYGIGGAVVLRALLIGVGLSAIQAFESINLLFAAVLLFSSFKLLSKGDEEDEDLSNNAIVSVCRKLIPVTESYEKDNFFSIEEGVKKATPLLLALAVIELTDIFFAFDSIPAIFGVTQDPFIVLTSNIFAILGLRSLFTVVATSMADLRFLQPAIAAILGFIGAKLLADYFGYEIPTETSLVVVFTMLSGGVFFSLRFPKEDKAEGL